MVVIVVIGSGTSGDKDKKSDTGQTAMMEETSINEDEPKIEETSKTKEWQKIADFTAEANKQSATFHLEGGQQKIIYQTTGGDMAICSVYVMDEGTSLDENGGFPVVMIDGSKSDETLMRKSAGDYYFDLKIANGSCSIELQEYK